MYRLHSYMQGLRLQDMRQEALSLHRDIAKMKSTMNFTSSENALTSGVSIFPFGPENDFYLGDHEVLGKEKKSKIYSLSLSLLTQASTTILSKIFCC